MHPSITLALYIIGAAWIMLWAFLRARGSNKNEWRQSDWVLPAGIVYALAYLFSFSGLTGLLVFGGRLSANIIVKLREEIPWLDRLMPVVGEDQAIFIAPVISIAAIFVALRIKPIEDLDQRALAWLHSAEHCRDEVEKIRFALIRRSFEPSEDEIQKNRAKLQDYDVRITDNRLISSDDELVTLWRKTACLLRKLTESEKRHPKLLSSQDKEELREIIETDSRKTQHAVDIVKALQASKQSTRQTASPVQTSPVPMRQPRLALGGNAVLEAVRDDVDPKPQYTLPSDPRLRSEGGPYALMISSEDFAAALKSIQGYFIKEYDAIVDRSSFIAAKHIVYAGHGAEHKWNALKTAGFQGCGNLDRLSIDKVIKFFFASNLIILSLAFILFAFKTGTGPDPGMIFKMSIAFGFAVLSGAMIGSNRALARRSTTPWAAIAGAGAASLLMFLFVLFSFAVASGFYDLVAPESSGTNSAKKIGDLVFGRVGVNGTVHNAEFRDVVPWAVPIVITAVAVARISRFKWPERFSAVTHSVFDGIAMAGVLIVTIAVTLGLHAKMETIPSKLFVQNGEIQILMLGMPFSFFSILGFLVGLVVIRDVREIAISHI